MARPARGLRFSSNETSSNAQFTGDGTVLTPLEMADIARTLQKQAETYTPVEQAQARQWQEDNRADIDAGERALRRHEQARHN
jgi:hypothetical protein